MQALGSRLRHLRRVSGMTIEKCATKIRVTKGYLSKVETGQASPSVAVLGRLGEALGVPMSAMFDGGGSQHLSVVRKNERLALNRPGVGVGYQFDSIAYKKANRAVEAFIITLPAVVTEAERYRHPGEELLFMLEGRLLFRYGGAEYILKEGDCVYFDSSVEHRGEAYGNKPARALIVIVPGPSGPQPKHKKRA